MSNYAVVLQYNDMVVKSSNFGELASIGFTYDGKVGNFIHNGIKYIAIFIYSTKNFIAYAEEVKFNILIANVKKEKGSKYSGVDVKLWKSSDPSIDITFKDYNNLILAETGDEIYGVLRDSTGLCFNYHIWNYTQPYYGPQNPNLAPGFSEADHFSCETFEGSTIAKNFFDTYKNFEFYDEGVIQTDVRLVADVASLMKKTDEQMLLLFLQFTQIKQNVGPFKFTQNVDGSYSRQELLDYKKGLERWLQIYVEYKDKLTKLTNAEQLYVICNYLFKYNMLTLFSPEQKISMLRVLCQENLTDLDFISFNGDYQERETLALRIIQSVTSAQVDEFLEKLISNKISVKSLDNGIYGSAKTTTLTLYKHLFNQIDDFFGKDNFTAFIKELERMVLIKNNIDPNSTPTYTIADIEAKTKGQFIWAAKNDPKVREKKNNFKYATVENTDTKIKFSETICAEYKLVEVYNSSSANIPVSAGYSQVCVKESAPNNIVLNHFDLVYIVFYENPSFVGNNINDQYKGKHFLTFAGFIDYIIEKEKTETILDVFEAALFVITLAVGIGEVIAATKSLQIARIVTGAMVITGDTAAYLTTNQIFIDYLQERYPEDYQDILSVMRVAGTLASLGGGSVIGSGIFNRYTKLEAARFFSLGERVLDDVNLEVRLTQNERNILREGIERFKDGMFPVRYEAEVVSMVRQTEGTMKFYDDLALRAEIIGLDDLNKARFLDNTGDISEDFVIRLKNNYDFVPYWNSLSNSEKTLFNSNKVEYFKNWYKAKVITLAEELRASNIWLDVRRGSIPYKMNELLTAVEINIIYKANLRPSTLAEAGDAVATSGLQIGKTFDFMGIPKSAFEEPTWTSASKRNKSIKGFKNSINKHFKKIDDPEEGLPPLNKIILDFRNFDDFNPNLRTEILDYINSPNFKYKNLVNQTHFETIN